MKSKVILTILSIGLILFFGLGKNKQMRERVDKREALVNSLKNNLKIVLEVADAAKLYNLGCPLTNEQGIAAYFHYEEDGALRKADAAALIPGRPEDITEWLMNLEELPQWAFLTQDGSPSIQEVSFDEGTGLGSVRIEREIWKGRLNRFSHGLSKGVRVEMIDGRRLREAVLILGVLPTPSCADASIIVLRANWRLRLLPRLFGGEFKAIPALFVLRLRDDIIGQALREPHIFKKAFGVPMKKVKEGYLVILKDSMTSQKMAKVEELLPGDLVLCVKPGGIRVTVGKSRILDSLFARTSIDMREALRTFFSFLDGKHEIRGANLIVNRKDKVNELAVGIKPEDIVYSIDLVISEKDSSLIFNMGLVVD